MHTYDTYIHTYIHIYIYICIYIHHIHMHVCVCVCVCACACVCVGVCATHAGCRQSWCFQGTTTTTALSTTPSPH
jgi:hypothetical protein